MVAARCKETVEALIKSLTVQVNEEDCFSTLLGCISECRVDDSNFHLKMARVSGSFLKLPVLDLSWGLSEVEFVLLVEALKVNSTLTKLDLDFYGIGDQGATGLAEALKVNSTLTVLVLKDNVIGHQGATSIAEALKVNSTLTNLDLQHSYIGDQGATSIAEALKVNSTLTNLDLQDNDISDQGATCLVEALKMNSTLRFLDLSLNNVRKRVVSELRLLEHDSRIIKLHSQLCLELCSDSTLSLTLIVNRF